MVHESFGKKLKQIRRIAGFTQKDLSIRLNISRQAYSNYEQGRCIPPPDILAELSVLFNTNLFCLLFPSTLYHSKLESLINPLLISEEELNRLIYLYLKMSTESRSKLLEYMQFTEI